MLPTLFTSPSIMLAQCFWRPLEMSATLSSIDRNLALPDLPTPFHRPLQHVSFYRTKPNLMFKALFFGLTHSSYAQPAQASTKDAQSGRPLATTLTLRCNSFSFPRNTLQLSLAPRDAASTRSVPPQRPPSKLWSPTSKPPSKPAALPENEFVFDALT